MDKNIKANNVYEDEIKDSLDRLKAENNLEEFEYFSKLCEKYFDLQNLKSKAPKVVVLGANIPEEIIIGLGEVPHYIIGGSLGSCSWADSYVPRDTDSVSKSILGFLKNEEIKSFKDSLIIIPITCDSMRKIAYMLEDEFNIAVVDIPSDKSNKFAGQKWRDEIYKLKSKLEKHLGKKLSKLSLCRATVVVSNAREAMRRFVDLSKDKEAIISGIKAQFILNTYYFADDIEAWTGHLNLLCDEILRKSKNISYSLNKNPKVLVMGSPIYFPNFKIPFLLEDIHLSVGDCANIITQRMMLDYGDDVAGLSRDGLLNKIADINYEKDCSQAYVNNTTMFDLVKSIEAKNELDGVIYHVIKGQIEYDFELERYEDLFAKLDIPVFRLETDYNYQDIEQLRIRMEAFMEMIQHRLYQSRRVVS